MVFEDHFHEASPSFLSEVYEATDYERSRSGFLEVLDRNNVRYEQGMGVMPTSFIPRIIPASYLRVVHQVARALTKAQLNLLFHSELSDLLNLPGLNRLLIENLKIMDKTPARIVGGARYDFAIEGELTENNPPQLLEINNLDYGGIGWVPFTNRALLHSVPGLRDHVKNIDLDLLIAHNFSKLGKRVLMIVAGEETHSDYQIFAQGVRNYGLDIKLVNDTVFQRKLQDGKVSLSPKGVVYCGEKYDFIYLRTFSINAEVLEFSDAISELIASRVPMYDSFHALLLENKGLLGLLNRDLLTRIASPEDAELLEKAIPQTRTLTQGMIDDLCLDGTRNNYVLKKKDGHMGEYVLFGDEIVSQITLPGFDRSDWCLQKRLKLNTLDVDPVPSGPRRGIVDLAVYVCFDYDSTRPVSNRLRDFYIASLFTRCSGDKLKVNVAQGGCVVPVFVLRR